ncbi:MAG: shikimate kinase [Spirochaetales bacterium]
MSESIVLIGMPGAGKSTVGRALARRLGLDFVDTDDLIAHQEHCRPQEVLDRHGAVGFLEREEKALLGCSAPRAVISTGGSAVYSTPAMEHLTRLGSVVFLDLPLATVRRRIPNADTRAIVRAPGQSLDELFAERQALYLRWARHVVDASLGLDFLVSEIVRILER